MFSIIVAVMFAIRLNVVIYSTETELEVAKKNKIIKSNSG